MNPKADHEFYRNFEYTHKRMLDRLLKKEKN